MSTMNVPSNPTTAGAPRASEDQATIDPAAGHAARKAHNVAVALDLHARGYDVFFVDSGKIPYAGSHGHHDATVGLSDGSRRRRTPDEVRRLAAGRRDPVPAVAPDRGFAVLDIDPRHGGTPDAVGLNANELEVQTPGRGWHAYRLVGELELRNNALIRGVDVKTIGGYVVAPGAVLPDGRTYVGALPDRDRLRPMSSATTAILTAALARRAEPVASNSERWLTEEGGHTSRAAVCSVMGKLRNGGASSVVLRAACREAMEEGWIVDSGDPKTRPWTIEDLYAIADDYGRRASRDIDLPYPYPITRIRTVLVQAKVDLPSLTGWPAELDRAAFHGLAGEIVDAVSPHTEADRVALLGTILSLFGALAGGARTFYRGSRQAANLFVALVGDTSTGRKGTSYTVVRPLFASAVPGFDEYFVPGLGSGEGLVAEMVERADPRAIVMETELGRLLAAMSRSNTTISQLMRNAYDGAPLSRRVAQERQYVPGHHIGLLAHVTPEELRELLTVTQARNGFANRFVFLAVHRTQQLPQAPDAEPIVTPFAPALATAVAAAQAPASLELDAQGSQRWDTFYRSLPERRHGLVGALTARAETQVARFALVYALLDRANVISAAHLAAAEALWAYGERSARFIFGEQTGDRVADHLRRFLREEGRPFGQRELREATGIAWDRMQTAIGILEDGEFVARGLGESKSQGGRRKQLVWSTEVAE